MLFFLVIEKISFLSMPRMLTLLSPNKKDRRIIFMLTPSCAFSNFGIENYEIRFIHPETRKIILSFNILSLINASLILTTSSIFM